MTEPLPPDVERRITQPDGTVVDIAKPRLAHATLNDVEIASDLKERLRAKLSELLPIMDEVYAKGFHPSWQIAQTPDRVPRNVLMALWLDKRF